MAASSTAVAMCSGRSGAPCGRRREPGRDGSQQGRRRGSTLLGLDDAVLRARTMIAGNAKLGIGRGQRCGAFDHDRTILTRGADLAGAEHHELREIVRDAKGNGRGAEHGAQMSGRARKPATGEIVYGDYRRGPAWQRSCEQHIEAEARIVEARDEDNAGDESAVAFGRARATRVPQECPTTMAGPVPSAFEGAGEEAAGLRVSRCDRGGGAN